MEKQNVNGVNLNGHTIDPQVSRLVEALTKMKQGAVLNRSHFKLEKIQIIPDVSRIPENEIIRKVKSDMISELANRMFENISIELTAKENNEFKFTGEVFVFNKEAFKHTIEYCIKEMPIESISKIRNESTV